MINKVDCGNGSKALMPPFGWRDRISGLELTSCFTSRVNVRYRNIQSERKVPVQKGWCTVTSVMCLWWSLPTLNRKDGIITVTATLTYILLLTGPQGLFAHSV